MKLSKFLLVALTFTMCSLLYVRQQSEIFRLAYLGQKKSSIFADLLEKNTLLRYNIESNASLVRIGDQVSGAGDYEMPMSFQMVKLNSPLENLKPTVSLPKKENMIARFFSIKREAQAKTINP